MLLNGEHNFAHHAPAAAAAAASGPSATCDADASPASSLDSNPNSQIQNPKSSARRAVPTTFNPIINDEANILAAISRGDRTIGDLAEEHGTTVSNFAVWLQREDIQRKLTDLTSAGATLTRIAAVNHLPKAVSALSFQIDGYIADRCRNLIKPGLDADRVAATRDANVRKAAHLLLRLAKFDPNQPVYRRTLAPRSNAERGEVASAQHAPVRGIFSNLTHADVVMPDDANDTEHARLVPSTSPKGEVAAKPPEGASAFSPAFPTSPPSSASTSHVPVPTSDIDERAPAFTPASSSRLSDFTSHIPLPTSHIDSRDELLTHGPAP